MYKSLAIKINEHLDDDKKLDLNFKPFPSRKQVEDAVELVEKIEVGFYAAEQAISLYLWYSDLKGNKIDILDEFTESFTKKALREIAENIDCKPIKYLAMGFIDKNSVGSLLENTGEQTKDDIVENILDETIISELYEILENSSAKVVQEIKLSDTGFRVLVLKKGDDIVISYKGKKTDNRQMLPEEINYLEIVYNRIKREYSDCRITFTGYEGGADLAFINAFNIDDKKVNTALFYNEIEKIKGFIDFTEKDIDKEYKSDIDIIILECTETTKDIAKDAFCAMLVYGFFALAGKDIALGVLGGHLLVGTVIAVLWIGVEVIKKYYKKAQIKKKYEMLMEKGLIKDKKNEINGYIADDYVVKDYIEFNTIEGEKIKIKKEHAFFLIMKYDHIIISKHEDSKYKALKVSILEKSSYEMLKEVDKDLRKEIASFEMLRDDQKAEIIRERYKEKADDAERYAVYWRLEKLSKNSDIYGINGFVLEVKNSDKVEDISFEEELTEEEKIEISNGIMFANLLQIIGVMQRNYENKKRDIAEFIYLTEEGVKISNEVNEKAIKDCASYKSDYNYNPLNEYFFLPFIDQKGNFIMKNENDEKALIIREEYIISVIKSKIFFYDYFKKNKGILEIINDKNNSSPFKGALYMSHMKFMLEKWEEKYGIKESFSEKISTKLNRKEVNQYLIGILENNEMTDFIRTNNPDPVRYENKYKIPFNHEKLILKEIKKNPEVLEKCYKLDELEDGSLKIFNYTVWSNIKGKIILNPDADSVMEYKYNYLDLIIGGTLEIYAEKMLEEVIEKENFCEEYYLYDFAPELNDIALENIKNNEKATFTNPLVGDIEKCYDYHLLDEGKYQFSLNKKEDTIMARLNLYNEDLDVS